jgi:hypothetical protein
MDELDAIIRRRFRDERSGRFGAGLLDGPADDDDPGDEPEGFDQILELVP